MYLMTPWDNTTLCSNIYSSWILIVRVQDYIAVGNQAAILILFEHQSRCKYAAQVQQFYGDSMLVPVQIEMDSLQRIVNPL